MYARFFTKVIHDMGIVDCDEPFKNLLTQGMVLKDGSKMSKSKGNTVDPDEIFENYGADTARLFILSDSPPGRDFDWSDAGVEGCYKFVNRLWRLFVQNKDNIIINYSIPQLSELSSDNNFLLRQTHIAVKKITQDINAEFQFNTVISMFREFSNTIYDYLAKKSELNEQDKNVLSFALLTLLKLIAPVVPFMSEELGEILGLDKSIHEETWPTYDDSLAKMSSITLVVQINGKIKDKIDVEADMTKEELEKTALQSEKIKGLIAGQNVVKVITVPGKLVNIVVK